LSQSDGRIALTSGRSTSPRVDHEPATSGEPVAGPSAQGLGKNYAFDLLRDIAA